MPKISATVICASRATNGVALYTIVCTYPRFILAEVNTHRVLSRNSMSSRAVPVKKVLAQVWSDPMMPVEWGANQAGMQAHTQLTGWRKLAAKLVWKTAAKTACVFAYLFSKIGLAKQVANRLLEPWQAMTTLITATEWENFFLLRDHKDAQPEFRELARMIRLELDRCHIHTLKPGEWHLPFVLDEEKSQYDAPTLIKISAARCARVSYLTHDGENPSKEKDLALFERLVGSVPAHSSPVEHQATPADDAKTYSNNFRGWLQYRALLDASR
jgi:Thymidylate synthase complementing protein